MAFISMVTLKNLIYRSRIRNTLYNVTCTVQLNKRYHRRVLLNVGQGHDGLNLSPKKGGPGWTQSGSLKGGTGWTQSGSLKGR